MIPRMNFRLTLLKTSFLSFAILLFVCLSSCTSYKDIPYFQQINRSQVTEQDLNNYSSLVIQPEDQIAINVSSLNPEASSVFNNNMQNSGTDIHNPTFGYIVDKNGKITLPLVGEVKAAGLTTDELSAQLKQKVTVYLREPTVSVRVVSFKVAVLGDVMRPNIYSSSSERLTIPEALSLAGDLNITAKRKNVLLVREINGKRKFIPIDLTSKDVFQSPYFYLKSNDLIYVEPSKLKLATVDTGYRNASLIISALSLLAITYSIIK